MDPGAVWNADGPERDGVRFSHPPPMPIPKELTLKMQLLKNYLEECNIKCKIGNEWLHEGYLQSAIVASNNNRCMKITDGDGDSVHICDQYTLEGGEQWISIGLSNPNSLESIRDIIRYCLNKGECAHCPSQSPHYGFKLHSNNPWRCF